VLYNVENFQPNWTIIHGAMVDGQLEEPGLPILGSNLA